MILSQLVEAKDLCHQAALCLLEAENGDPALLAEAAGLYGEALAACPELEEPYLALAWLAWQTGQSQAARQLLKTVLGLNPAHAYAHRLLAQLGDEEASAFEAQTISFPTSLQ